MKIGLPLLLALLSLLACKSKTDNSQTQDQAARSKILDSPAKLRGYFVKAAHDGAWLLQLQEKNGNLSGQLINYGGMLPPAEFLDSKDAEEDVLKKLEITQLKPDLLEGTFESNLGKGRFTKKKIRFDELEGIEEHLVLVREASYPSPE